MANNVDPISRLRAALGYKPLNRTWAKREILLGLFAAAVGLLLGEWAVAHRRKSNGQRLPPPFSCSSSAATSPSLDRAAICINRAMN